ncbi:MAG: pyridoxamine 5'-phosphate oxidase [Bacteroidales bacterium]|nr:pyridoxamine 5'-phosphate oxidase [Bacteroidales bacterium]
MYNLSDYRKNYSGKVIIARKNPFKLFEKWFQEAEKFESFEVNAMVLSTVDEQLQPHSRVVLLKSFSEKGFVFFTHYSSAKGKQIEHNQKVSLLFFWQTTERQVRILGTCQKISAAESDKYFYSRPVESQKSAMISKQSEILPSRAALIRQFKNIKHPVRPETWGGYLVVPYYFEFWQGMPSRLHDRVAYSIVQGEWSHVRLYP